MVKPLKTQFLFYLHRLYPVLGSHSFLNFSSQPDFVSEICSATLVYKVCHILSQSQWHSSSELNRLSPNLNPHHVSKIIDAHKSTDSVLTFFYWVSKRPFYKHDSNCFVAMLNRLIRDRHFEPTDHVRILMIKSCKNEEEMKWVVEYLNEI